MIDWLISTLIATSGLMVLVLFIRNPIRHAFGSSVAYALWLFPAARAFLPSFTQTVERVVPQSAPLNLASLQTSAVDATTGPSTNWPLLIIAAWLAGAGAMLIRGIVIYHRQRSGILGNSVQMARLGSIRIVRSERVRGPIAFGIIDRVIVVPLDFDRTFTDRQRCLALEHELSHHRCGDMVANLFAFVLLCLQWFNPLAWAAHAAFRFDQEAACDARVLDKAQPGERAFYGAAIAKAASGRTFLFSGALDRPSTLSRRLTIMTNMHNEQRRRAGFAIVGGALMIALPLTASWAIDYVDIAAPTPVAAVKPLASITAPIATTAAVAPVAAVPSIAPVPAVASTTASAVPAAASAANSSNYYRDDDLSIDDDSVYIDGKRKRFEELTPQERARVRATIAQARKSIDEQVRKLPEQMASMAKSRQQFENGDFKRQMADARESIRKAMAELDSNAKLLRATGQDPERMKADMRRSLKEVEEMNVNETVRKSLEGLNPEKVRVSIMDAAKSIERIEAKLNQLRR